MSYRMLVRHADGSVGQALDEPYLVVKDGRLVSIDGASEFRLPVRKAGASPLR